MNGIQIERVLQLIDSNINANLQGLHGVILQYLQEHGDDLAKDISQKGFGDIPIGVGVLRITREDLEGAAA